MRNRPYLFMFVSNLLRHSVPRVWNRENGFSLRKSTRRKTRLGNGGHKNWKIICCYGAHIPELGSKIGIFRMYLYIYFIMQIFIFHAGIPLKNQIQ